MTTAANDPLAHVHGLWLSPVTLRRDQVKAPCKNGVLESRMPKTEEAKKKAITVKID